MDSDGVIEVHDKGKVLSFNKTTNEVEYVIKKIPVSASQKWTLGPQDGLGWQTIQHVESGLYLTARYKHPNRKLTVENKGR